jgi:DNA-binding IclR family transcriptional regulator
MTFYSVRTSYYSSGTASRRRSSKTAGKAVGVTAVDRALSIFKAFRIDDRSLTLHELANRTGLYKSTILRLLESLMRNGCIEQLEDGSYQLGSMLFHWGSIYRASLRLEDHIQPVLRRIVAETGEDVTFFRRVGDARVCLFNVPSPQAIRVHLRTGDLLPLNSGAGGRVLQLFDPTNMAPPSSPLIATFGDREPDIAAVGVPVFGTGDSLQGSITVSGPLFRFTEQALSVISKALIDGAVELTRRFGGDASRLISDGVILDYSATKRVRLSTAEPARRAR